MESRFISGTTITLDARVELLRSLFKTSQEFSAKHGRNYITMDFIPKREDEQIFLRWLTSTTHDAYFYNEQHELQQFDEDALVRITNQGIVVTLFFLEK